MSDVCTITNEHCPLHPVPVGGMVRVRCNDDPTKTELATVFSVTSLGNAASDCVYSLLFRSKPGKRLTAKGMLRLVGDRVGPVYEDAHDDPVAMYEFLAFKIHPYSVGETVKFFNEGYDGWVVGTVKKVERAYDDTHYNQWTYTIYSKDLFGVVEACNTEACFSPLNYPVPCAKYSTGEKAYIKEKWGNKLGNIFAIEDTPFEYKFKVFILPHFIGLLIVLILILLSALLIIFPRVSTESQWRSLQGPRG